MSSQGFEGALELRPRPSRWLARTLFAAHGLAAVAVVAGVPHRGAMIGLLLALTLSAYHAFKVHVQRRNPSAIRRAVWHSDGRWFVENNARVTAEARLQPHSYLHPRLVILHFEMLRCGSKNSLLLLPDSLDFQTLRLLRARLRLVGRNLGATSP